MNTTTFEFCDHISLSGSAIDSLDEARLLALVLQETFVDDMAKFYQCQLIIAKISEAMSKMRTPPNPE